MTEKSSPPTRRDQLVDAMLDLVAERGLDALSVREVARAGGVSIGTVQHHFATKDAMLAAAFGAVVERIRARVERVVLGPDVRRNLSRVLSELLPLDDARRAEGRVQLAFTARAAVTPGLAEIQRGILNEIVDGLAVALSGLGLVGDEAVNTARVALAAVDGLAQHALSTADPDPEDQTTALELLLDRLIPTRPTSDEDVRS